MKLQHTLNNDEIAHFRNLTLFPTNKRTLNVERTSSSFSGYNSKIKSIMCNKYYHIKVKINWLNRDIQLNTDVPTSVSSRINTAFSWPSKISRPF